MGHTRFWRRFKIAPGVTLNVSKSGVSVSLGPQGAKVTVGTSGSRATVGVPGTGLHYTHQFTTGKKKGGKKKKKAAAADEPAQIEGAAPAVAALAAAPAVAALTDAGATGDGGSTEVPLPVADSAPIPQIPLDDDERVALESACEAVRDGDEEAALQLLAPLSHHPDAAFLSGVLLLKGDGNPSRAAGQLRSAFANRHALGHGFEEVGHEISLELPITDEVTVRLRPDPLGAALAFVEALQRMDRIDEGIAVLEQLQPSHPGHPLLAMSLEDLRASS